MEAKLMKTPEELNALTEEKIAQVTGGVDIGDLGDRVFGQSGFEPVGIVPVPSEFDILIEGGQQQREP